MKYRSKVFSYGLSLVTAVAALGAILCAVYPAQARAQTDPLPSMLVFHDDAKREYAYGPAQGLPDTRVGTFTQALYDEAKKDGWIVISMKDDWKRIFAFEN
jgi:hypothetical protein